MDFFTETKGKIKAVKENMKRTLKPIACLAVGAVMSSCAGTGVTTGNAVTTTYFYSNARVTTTQTSTYSSRDAAREARDYAAATRSYAQSFKTVAEGIDRLHRSFNR